MKTMTSVAVVFAAIALAGCTPSDAPPTEEPMPEVLENGSFTAELNGFDIHYEVHGQGPVLMALTNSWGLSLEGLRGILGPLEERLTMVYFDPRGMGGSAEIIEESDMGMAAVRADFQALREHLGLESVNAIGWSNGAMNLILLAAERPETIENAIFLHGTASFTQEDSVAYAEQYPEMLEAWKALLEEMENPDLTDDQRTERMRAMWLGEWFPISFADRAAAPQVLDRIFADAEFSWAHADYSQREYPEFDARNLLPQITARSLVITGAHDAMPVSKGEEMAAGIPDAEFALFESSGHYAPAEEPEAFEDLVFRFLGVN
ncbi:MAG: alpha/beta hydrolase [Thermoanaerobaculales bacterium]|nr:alpha/beta hydrolase [Thermoanaerobaculales bacterium]